MTSWLAFARRAFIVAPKLDPDSKFQQIASRTTGHTFVVGTWLAVWIGTVGFGWWQLTAYENTPGRAAVTSGHWPRASAIERRSDRATLVVFAHPRCPCSRATLEELAAILAASGDRLNACVVFSPYEVVGESEDTDLMRQAERITGVRVLRDRTGRETACFGATTSGQTFLYDCAGALRFQGGITASRGHAGDNAGHDAVIDVLNGRSPQQNKTFVFGCALTEDVSFSSEPRS